MKFENMKADVVIIGGGASGLAAAIAARRSGKDVLLISRTRPGRGNTTAVSYANINAALACKDPGDNPEEHFADSLRGGQELNDRRLLTVMVEEAVARIPALEEFGVSYVRENGQLLQFQAAGHSRPRTLMASSKMQGSELTRPLVKAASRLGVRFLERVLISKILISEGRVVGLVGLGLDWMPYLVKTPAVVLASGGAGLLFERNSIPAGTPGNGFALALEVGAVLRDMEFIQFFPTKLVEPNLPNYFVMYDGFLNCGAVIRNAKGESITEKWGYHDPTMLSREQLSIAIGRELIAGGGIEGAVLLDARHARSILEHPGYGKSPFVQRIKEELHQGRDLLQQPFRLAPFAHYFMGGVEVDEHGFTGVPGLWACGEVCGGLHGANRMHGNALSDAIVFGSLAGEQAAASAAVTDQPLESKLYMEELQRYRRLTERRSETLPGELYMRMNRALTGVGMVKEAEMLQRAYGEIEQLERALPQVYAENHDQVTSLLVLPGLLLICRSVIRAALLREESRGAHFRLDFPGRDDQRWLRHVYHRLQNEKLETWSG